MKSTIVRVRLNPDEVLMLAKVCQSQDRGELNSSELIRLLIRREFLRRTTGRSAVPSSAVSSDFRTGRPRGEAKDLTDAPR